MADVKRLGSKLHYDLRREGGAMLAKALQRSGMPEDEFREWLHDMTGLPVPHDTFTSFLAGAEFPMEFLVAAEVLASSRGLIEPSERDHLEERESQLDLREGRSHETLALATEAAALDLSQANLEAIQRAVDLLCREYSTTSPHELIPRAQQRVRQILTMRKGRVSVAQHRALSISSGWLYLLLGALHFDVGEREAAEAAKDAASHLGCEGGNDEIRAWAFETAAYFSVFDKRARNAVDLSLAGQEVAPDQTSARVATTMQEARAWARLGDRHAAEQALVRGYATLDQLPLPSHPEHHFVWDQPKFSYYATTTYAWLRMARQTERYAAETIDQFSDPARRNWWPGRVAGARLDLALAQAQQGRFDEAGHSGNQALTEYGVRTWILRRARDLNGFLEGHDDVREVREFHERFRHAKNTFDPHISW